MTQLEITTSTLSFGSGSFSTYPLTNSTLPATASAVVPWSECSALRRRPRDGRLSLCAAVARMS
jgi:hypothetical protein